MAEVKLNWAQAAVQDGTLTVPLEGELPSEWDETFGKTIRLLGSGEWGEVKLEKQTVHVEQVSPGIEDKLRHYLESVVEQANESDRPEETERGEDQDDDSELEGPDAEMTERFREFAPAEPESESGSGTESESG